MIKFLGWIMIDFWDYLELWFSFWHWKSEKKQQLVKYVLVEPDSWD